MNGLEDRYQATTQAQTAQNNDPLSPRSDGAAAACMPGTKTPCTPLQVYEEAVV